MEIEIKTIDDCNIAIKELCKKYAIPVAEFGAKFKQNYNIALQFFTEIKNAAEQKFVVCREVLMKMDENYEYDFARYDNELANKVTIAFNKLKNGSRLEYKDAFGNPMFIELTPSKKAFDLLTYKIFDEYGKKASERIANEYEIENHLMSLISSNVAEPTNVVVDENKIAETSISIDKSELAPLPKLKKTDLIGSFKNIVSDDEMRPIQGGVFFDATNGNVVATDSNSMVVLKNVKMPSIEIPELWLNKVVDINPIKHFVGEEDVLKNEGIQAVEKRREEIRIIPGIFPPYKKIIPKTFRYEFTINIDELYQLSLTALSKITEKFKSKYLKNSYKNHLIHINCGEFTVKVPPFVLKNVLEFFKQKNETTAKIKLISSDKGIIFETEKIMGFVFPQIAEHEETFYDFNISLSIDDLKQELAYLNYSISELDINNENSENYFVQSYHKYKENVDDIGMESLLSLISKDLDKLHNEKQTLLSKYPELMEFDVNSNQTSIEPISTEETPIDTKFSSTTNLVLSPDNKKLIDVLLNFSEMSLKNIMEHTAYFVGYGVVVANMTHILFIAGTPSKLAIYELLDEKYIGTKGMSGSIFDNKSIIDQNIQSILSINTAMYLDVDIEKLSNHVSNNNEKAYFKINDSFGLINPIQIQKFISTFTKLNITTLRIFFNGKDGFNPFNKGFVFASQNSSLFDVQNMACDLIICSGFIPENPITGNIPNKGVEYLDLSKNEVRVFGSEIKKQTTNDSNSDIIIPKLHEVLTNKSYINTEYFKTAQAAQSISERLNVNAEKAYNWLNKFHFEVQFLYIMFENPSIFIGCIINDVYTDEAKELIQNREASRKESYVKPVDNIKTKPTQQLEKLASSGSIEGLTKLLNEYFYSTTYKILPDLSVINYKGVFDKVIVKNEKNRYVLYYDNSKLNNTTPPAPTTDVENIPTTSTSLESSNENYEIKQASYSKGNYAIFVKDTVGNKWKNRTANLCEAGGVNGKYSGREKAYIVSENGVKNFIYLFENGYDYSPISDTLELPEKKQEEILNELNIKLKNANENFTFNFTTTSTLEIYLHKKILEISFKTPTRMIVNDLFKDLRTKLNMYGTEKDIVYSIMEYMVEARIIDKKYVKEKSTKLASAGSIEALTKLLNKYFYSTSYIILDDLSVMNNKGVFDKVFVTKEKNRYVLYYDNTKL